MNITSVNVTGNSGLETNARQSPDASPSFYKGQVVDGLITEVSDKISITFSGKEVKVSKSAVQNATEGEIRKFEIMDVSEKSIVLKEVGSSTGGTNQKKIIGTTVETNQAAFTTQLLDASDENLKEEEAKDAQKKLEDIASRMSKADALDLEKEGISLELYELERLERALARIKSQREFKDDSTDRQVEELKTDREELKNVSSGSGYLSDKIEQKLEEADLPVTKENIEKIESALKMADSSIFLSDKSMAYLIDNELSPTAQNVYKARYSGESRSYAGYQNQKTEGVSDEAWNQIRKQAEAVIKKAGMEVNEQSLGSARWLLENNLGLTQESLQNLQGLINLKDNYSSEGALDTMVAAFAKGIQPDQASLSDNTYGTAIEALNTVKQVSDEAIIKVNGEQREMNLSELKKAQDEIQVQNTSNYSINGNFENNNESNLISNMSIEEITARRQIEEIRLKLTIDSASVLIKNGIDPNTASLEKIVQGLRDQEDQYYRNLLQNTNVADQSNAAVLLRETTERLNELKSLPCYILGSTLSTRSIQSIDSLTTLGSGLKSSIEKAGQTYESLMTTPRKDLGDSIQKAFRNVDSILEDMNLEKTEANQRAVRILGYNSMEITQEAITQVKAYDSQVNTLMKELHPAVTVQMIQEGINPINMTVGELNQKISEMKEELGITDEMKYSKYLWQLEKDDALSEEERKTYIGIYRLLNNISKTDGAAIGSVLQADQEVTLRNLMTAVKTIKSGGIDQSVDDSFGMLENLTYSSETLSQQLAAAYQDVDSKNENDTENKDKLMEVKDSSSEKPEEVSYMTQLLNDILEKISPDAVKQISGNQDGRLDEILNMSLEQFQEEISTAKEEDNSYTEDMLSQIRELSKGSEKAVRLLVEYNQPVNIQNLMTANQLLSDGRSFYKKVLDEAETLEEVEKEEISDVVDGFVDALEDESSIKAQYDMLQEGLNYILKNSYENTITSDDMKAIQLLGNSMNMVQSLSQNRYYEIPVMVDGSITSMNVTIVNGTEDNGKVKLKYDSDNLGQIEGVFTLKEKSLKGLIMSDSREGLNLIKENISYFEDALMDMDTDIVQLDYAASRRNQTSFSNKMNNVDNSGGDNNPVATKDLYYVAKNFVKYLKKCETSLNETV